MLACSAIANVVYLKTKIGGTPSQTIVVIPLFVHCKKRSVG